MDALFRDRIEVQRGLAATIGRILGGIDDAVVAAPLVVGQLRLGDVVGPVDPLLEMGHRRVVADRASAVAMAIFDAGGADLAVCDRDDSRAG